MAASSKLLELRRSGTNPTAAAVGVLQLLGGMTEEVRVGVVELLAGMTSAMEGGSICEWPCAVGGSTLYVYWYLDPGSAPVAPGSARPRFNSRVLGGTRDGGRGLSGPLDDRADVEYTFYGLGSLALFS